jgi:hypothetical protein
MASTGGANNDNTVVVSQNDAEHASGLHQRRHGALELQQHGSSSPDTSSPDVEAAISSNPSNDKDADVNAEAAGEQQVEEYAAVGYADIAKQFSILGWTAFGGPAAHIGMFQRVRSRRQLMTKSLCLACSYGLHALNELMCGRSRR